jgi:hypothetical protein
MPFMRRSAPIFVLKNSSVYKIFVLQAQEEKAGFLHRRELYRKCEKREHHDNTDQNVLDLWSNPSSLKPKVNISFNIVES